MTEHYLEIHRNAEGNKLAYMSPMHENPELDKGGYRVAGPKAWGGSVKLADIKISTESFVKYIKCYAPDVMEALRPMQKDGINLKTPDSERTVKND